VPDSSAGPPLEAFLAAADAVARDRPGVDAHDTRAVVAGLCADLVTADPGAVLRARSRATADDPGDRHDPEAVSAAHLLSAQVLQL
jgi:hypothetical protein